MKYRRDKSNTVKRSLLCMKEVLGMWICVCMHVSVSVCVCMFELAESVCVCVCVSAALARSLFSLPT